MSETLARSRREKKRRPPGSENSADVSPTARPLRAVRFERRREARAIRYDDEMTTSHQPAIASFRWGRVEDSRGAVFKDARFSPAGTEEWDWRATGTRHVPGIQIADLEDLLHTPVQTILLSRGVDLVLQVPQATFDFARHHAREVLVLQSEAAVAEYNRRVASEPVILLLHSTC
jgi:hypothetical protein